MAIALNIPNFLLKGGVPILSVCPVNVTFFSFPFKALATVKI